MAVADCTADGAVLELVMDACIGDISNKKGPKADYLRTSTDGSPATRDARRSREPVQRQKRSHLVDL
ncbi:hypothetical protein GCM10027176_51580 [Actinoallomurus bryophytorum]